MIYFRVDWADPDQFVRHKLVFDAAQISKTTNANSSSLAKSTSADNRSDRRAEFRNCVQRKCSNQYNLFPITVPKRDIHFHFLRLSAAHQKDLQHTNAVSQFSAR